MIILSKFQSEDKAIEHVRENWDKFVAARWDEGNYRASVTRSCSHLIPTEVGGRWMSGSIEGVRDVVSLIRRSYERTGEIEIAVKGWM